jgi:hypothetical protein
MSFKLIALMDGKEVKSHMVLKSDTNPTHTMCGLEIRRHTMAKLVPTPNTCMNCFTIAAKDKGKITKET